MQRSEKMNLTASARLIMQLGEQLIEDELVALEAEASQRIGGQRGNQYRADNRGARHQHGVEEVLGNTALPCERIVIPERVFGHRPNVLVNFLVAFQGVADHPE